MSSNKTIHRLLAQMYGDKCMFIEAHLEDIHYRRYLKLKKYKCKDIIKLKRILTVHHLKHKSEGGKTNLDNCSLVNELAHRYLHSLPRDIEELYNNAIREWKEARVVEGDIELPFEINYASFGVDRGGHMKSKKLQEIKDKESRKELQDYKKEYEDR